MALGLRYFYGCEAEQYTFYRIPKVLFTDRRYQRVSMEAKILYGLMLDRMGLSARNGWLDSDGRVYIYFTLEDALVMLGCGKDKAVRLFKELDQNGGIGLIERRKQGQGRPTRVYVKNFTLPPDPEDKTSEKPKSALPASAEVQTSGIPKPGLRESRCQDFGISALNKTERNQTEYSKIESSIGLPQGNWIERMAACRTLLRENISYPVLLSEHPFDVDLIDGYVELMAEVCCTAQPSVRINREELPAAAVRNRFLKLEKEHIVYVMDRMRNNAAPVGNIRAYTLSALYNAPVTMGQYYAALVSHDLAQEREAGP